MVTCTLLGLQPAESAYLTEKVNRVAVVPEVGDATPWLRVMAWDAPAQLAPSANGAVASMLPKSASAMTRRRRIAVPPQQRD
jgi:hypothetical protein